MAELKIIECSTILANPKNNVSRQRFAPSDCADLAASISHNGLQQPVIVCPTPEGTDHNYRLVIGYRRFTAVSVNLDEKSIECIVRGYTEDEANMANLVENLQRKDISFWEQCCGLKMTFPKGTQMSTIALALSYSDAWVRPRWKLWEMPKSIQDGVEIGLYGPAEIGVIYQQDPKERLRAAAKLKAGKAAGKTVKDLQRALTGRKSHRSKKEVKRMMTLCMECGHTGAVQALRYACGEISDSLLLELLDNPAKDGILEV